MYSGKTLFAQIMDFLPWSTFQRIVTRYGGDYRIRTFRCTEQFRIMAFAQLTYRESLRDIEACLSAQVSKLYHMGLRGVISRSTLADANESRDWRIYADFAQRLISQARKLYSGEDLGVDLSNTVYALDSTTIDLCLSMFPWAPFRVARAAVKLHTLLDIKGAIPSFIHISDGKWHDVNILDLLIPEPGAFYVMDRGYLDFARLYALHQSGSFFVTRAKSNLNARRLYSAPIDRSSGVICDQTILLNGSLSHNHYPENLRRIRFKDADSGKTLIFLTNHTALPALTICALYKKRWQIELFFKWIKQHLRINRFYGTSENAVKTQIWIAVSTYLLIAIIKKRLNLETSLYTLLQILSVTLFEKKPLQQALQTSAERKNMMKNQNQLNLFNS
ncbi:MAG: IS4 family transposase [Nitrospirae bacterium]|nr:IS4 family transposase [Nitrospirota bacterium]